MMWHVAGTVNKNKRKKWVMQSLNIFSYARNIQWWNWKWTDEKNHPAPSHLCDAHVTGEEVHVDPELCGNDSQQVHSHSLHGFYAITKALVNRYLALIWSKVLYKEKKNKNQQIVLARHLKVKSEDEQRVTSSWRAADSCEGLIIIVRKRHLAL